MPELVRVPFHASPFEYLRVNLPPVLCKVFQVALATPERRVPFQRLERLGEFVRDLARYRRPGLCSPQLDGPTRTVLVDAGLRQHSGVTIARPVVSMILVTLRAVLFRPSVGIAGFQNLPDLFLINGITSVSPALGDFKGLAGEASNQPFSTHHEKNRFNRSMCLPAVRGLYVVHDVRNSLTCMTRVASRICSRVLCNKRLVGQIEFCTALRWMSEYYSLRRFRSRPWPFAR